MSGGLGGREEKVIASELVGWQSKELTVWIEFPVLGWQLCCGNGRSHFINVSLLVIEGLKNIKSKRMCWNSDVHCCNLITIKLYTYEYSAI